MTAASPKSFSMGVAAAHASPEALSLSSLFMMDFGEATRQLHDASCKEPFHPHHEVRRALLLARFGEFTRASVKLEHVKELLPNLPILDYLRALFALRSGKSDQARAIAGSLETAHPQFIPTKFLRAEIQVRLASKAGGAEKYLTTLPTGREWDSLWADLLVKLALLHPNDGAALAKRYLDKKLPADSRAFALVTQVLMWAGASMDQLGKLLAQEPPGSKSEALILERLIELLFRVPSEKAIGFLHQLRKLHPQRAALRSVYNSFLTHWASELSSKTRHDEAVRLAEQCLREEPQDLIYHQNRAALFTLLREPAAYHEAWADLNRHQYRLVLLGVSDPYTLRQIAITHRLFAQQARAGVHGQRGVFRLVEAREQENGREEPRLVTNSEEINGDPDLLRQWIHHMAAEFVFRHLLLGSLGRRALLEPESRDEATKRVKGLEQLANSLPILVQGEGATLAETLTARWRKNAASVSTRYQGYQSPGSSADSKQSPAARKREADEDVQRIRKEHVETIADLCLICLQWRPASDQLWVAEELLDFIAAEAPFFDEETLYELEVLREEASPNIRTLSWYVRLITGAERQVNLTPEQRQSVINAMMAELLREMGNSAYAGNSGSAKESAAAAMPFVDRARALRSNDASIELTAAEFLTSGEFFQEAQTTLERFRRLVKPEAEKLIERADKIAEILRERRKEGKTGERREKTENAKTVSAPSHDRILQLEQEVERFPSSWRVYEELVHELGIASQFEEAVQWADRAVSHCLSRAEQMNARGLAIEARGLKALAATDANAARLYAAGAHDPARRALEVLVKGAKPDYAILYLLGRCQLAAGETEAARESFRQGTEVCDRQLHRTPLRALTDNVDSAYLALARSSLTITLQEGAMADALAEAVVVFSRLQEPAAWLVDFARIFYTSAVSRVGTEKPPLTRPHLRIAGALGEAIQNALAHDDDADCALALTEVAARFHAPSARPAQALAERTRRLEHQIEGVEALREAGNLLNLRQFEPALAIVEQLDPATASEPRLLRIRALALLGLGRFDEAGLVVQQIGQGGSAEVREFVATYPRLVFRHRVALAQQLLKNLETAEAEAALSGAIPTSAQEIADIAYCRAFIATLQAYELRRRNNGVAAHAKFVTAIELIEPLLHGAANPGGKHVTDLYDRLEKEIEERA